MATELVFQPVGITSRKYLVLHRGEEFATLEFARGGREGSLRIGELDYTVVSSGGRRTQIRLYHKERVEVLVESDPGCEEGWELSCEGERFHWFPESPGSRCHILKRPHRKRPAAYFAPVRWLGRRRVMETGKDVPVVIVMLAAWLALR